MQNSSLLKLLAALTALIVIVGIFLNFSKFSSSKTAKVVPKLSKGENYSATYRSPTSRVAKTKPQPEPDEPVKAPQISREQAEAWLAKHDRNAMSLLAAFRAMGDTNYLNEAAANFPNDPHVELAVLAHDEFPADRRKWLDLFKQSSPSNSVANYLLAQEDFKNGKTDEAVQELLAAGGKSQFDAYDTETISNSAELYSASDKSPIEVASLSMGDWAEEKNPALGVFKQIALGIGDLQKQLLAAGDADSAADLAQMGMNLANQINGGDSGKYLINLLVGRAIEAVSLKQLDQNTAYDFLDGQTPAQVAEALKQQKAELRQLMTDSGPTQMQMMMSESETANYMQHVKTDGELEAMKWLIQQHPQNPQ